MGRKWKRNRKNKHTGNDKTRDDHPTNESGSAAAANDSTTSNNNNRNNNNNSVQNGGGQERDPYRMIDHGNFKMEAFYAYQGTHDYYFHHRKDNNNDDDDGDDDDSAQQGRFVPCTTQEEREAERQRWLTAVKTILPAAFRIGQDVDPTLRERLEHELDEYVGKKMEIVMEPKGGQQRIDSLQLKAESKWIEPVKRLKFVPHGYQLGVDRGTLRRNTDLRPFHDWLKVQTDAGFVTRQETVSMIPPVVLAPQPHHLCLDMAAAPGSKTSQLLEVVNLPAQEGDTEPRGCVVANDSDVKRAYMLVHQMRRINSPALFITSCDARFFPLLKDETKKTQGEDEGIFDRVLADVPCSGDGTTRKNPGVWKKWNSLNSYALHPLQLAIALRGAQSTKVGGYLCYSTCSMNPIENEAVVAELLRSSDGSLELVERNTNEHMPGLLARPGMTNWKNLAETKSNRQAKDHMKKNNDKMKVRRKAWEKEQNDHRADVAGAAPTNSVEIENNVDSTNQEGTSTAEIEKEESPGMSFKLSIQTPFEPTSMDKAELKKLVEMAGMVEYDCYDDVPEIMRKRIRPTCFAPTPEEAATMNLHHCMRILPQDMDTGGFFVALLKKVAPLNVRARKRFEALQRDIEGDGGNKDSDGDKTIDRVDQDDIGEDEPAVKKPRVETAASCDIVETDTNDDKVAGTNVKPATAIPDKEASKGFKKRKKQNDNKDDFTPIPDDILTPLKDYYGLDDESFKEGQYMVRVKGDSKVLYFMTKTVKTKLIDRGLQDKVTTVTSGVKGFVRNNKDCEVSYRIAQDGVHFVAPHMSKRKLCADLEDFEKCLSAPTVQIEDFLSDTFKKEVRAFSVGCFVVQLKGFEKDYLRKLVICMWRCRSDTVNFLVPKAEIDGLQSKIRSLR